MKIVIRAFLVIMIIFYIGCSEDENPVSSDSLKNQIVGVWKEGSTKHTFTSDGKYSFYEEVLGDGKGSYYIDESVGKITRDFTLTYELFGERYSHHYTDTYFLEFSNSGNTMTWYNEPQRITVAGSFVKQK